MPRGQFVLPAEAYEHTHEEIGKELGVTAAMVRKIERRALAKLRAELEARGIFGADIVKEAHAAGLFIEDDG